MNWYYVGAWRGGEPVAADDAASAEWVPLARLGALRHRFSWPHMRALFGELRAWVAARPRARRASRPTAPQATR